MKRRLRFLTVEQVLAIHDAMLERFGGSPGGGPRGEAFEGVDAAVQAVKNSYYETVEELAAAHAIYIVQGHVFLDGNKRTALSSAAIFLHLNGFETSFPVENAERFMLAAAQRQRSLEEIVAWLKKHAKRSKKR